MAYCMGSTVLHAAVGLRQARIWRGLGRRIRPRKCSFLGLGGKAAKTEGKSGFGAISQGLGAPLNYPDPESKR